MTDRARRATIADQADSQARESARLAISRDAPAFVEALATAAIACRLNAPREATPAMMIAGADAIEDLVAAAERDPDRKRPTLEQYVEAAWRAMLAEFLASHPAGDEPA